MLSVQHRWLAPALLVFAGSSLAATVSKASDPTVISCNFEHMPPMLMIVRGGMGADDNSLQIGQRPPVPLNVGSSLMSAEVGGQRFTFSLRLPASVSVSAPGNDTMTYHGECISSLQP